MKSQGKIEMEAVTLPSVDQALFDVVVAAFSPSPVTDEEFKKAQRVSNSDHKIEDVIDWAKVHWDAQE
jgi:hypothetical protein